MLSCSVVSDSVRPYGQQPTRLLCPLDSLGKNTGVGCHFLLQMTGGFSHFGSLWAKRMAGDLPTELNFCFSPSEYTGECTSWCMTFLHRIYTHKPQCLPCLLLAHLSWGIHGWSTGCFTLRTLHTVHRLPCHGDLPRPAGRRAAGPPAGYDAAAPSSGNLTRPGRALDGRDRNNCTWAELCWENRKLQRFKKIFDVNILKKKKTDSFSKGNRNLSFDIRSYFSL